MASPPTGLVGDAARPWFYVDENGNQQGPVNARELGEFAEDGFITADTQGWKEGMPGWAPLGGVAELQATFAGVARARAAKEAAAVAEAAAAAERAASQRRKRGTAVAKAEWYYGDAQGGQQGPATARAISALKRASVVGDATLVWKEGMSGWVPMASAPELLAAIAAAEAPGGASAPPAGDDAAAAAKAAEKERQKAKKKAARKRKFQAVQDHGDVYVTGLPAGVTVDELHDHFKKGGIIKKGDDGEPRIKVYTDAAGRSKGDALVSYLLPDSVALAEQLLDETKLRGAVIRVAKADYSKTANKDAGARKKKSAAAKEAAGTIGGAGAVKRPSQKQALGWEEMDEEKGLCIVIVTNAFDAASAAAKNPNFYANLKKEVGLECEKEFGAIHKLTVFERSPDGAIAIRFKLPASARLCIEKMHGRLFDGRRLSCDYYDGVTDYKVKETEEEEAKRQAEFAKWIESQ